MKTIYQNSEGYHDPTAGQAIADIEACEKKYDEKRLEAISSIVPIIKRMAELLGFEIIGRIIFRDKETKKLYR